MKYKEEVTDYRIHLETNGKDLALRQRPAIRGIAALKEEIEYFLRSFLFSKGDKIVIEVLK